MDKIKIFYDGVAVNKYGKLPYVCGFTTNTSFMKMGNELNYKAFMEKYHEVIGDRCISLQLFADDFEEAYQQAVQIASLGKNIYVKVPIMNSKGVSNLTLIERLLQEGIQVNITAIFTKEQVVQVLPTLEKTKTPTIVSIFAGRISDTCVNPVPIVQYATQLFESYPHIEVLWAGCKETLSIQHAIDSKCHIITIPDSILDRMGRMGKDLTEFSLETVAAFRKDALDAPIQIV
jgi:transaldolase